MIITYRDHRIEVTDIMRIRAWRWAVTDPDGVVSRSPEAFTAEHMAAASARKQIDAKLGPPEPDEAAAMVQSVREVLDAAGVDRQRYYLGVDSDRADALMLLSATDRNWKPYPYGALAEQVAAALEGSPWNLSGRYIVGH